MRSLTSQSHRFISENYSDYWWLALLIRLYNVATVVVGAPCLTIILQEAFFFLALLCFVFTLWLISGEDKYMGNWMLQKMQLLVSQCEGNTYFPKTLCAAFYFSKKAVEMSYWGRDVRGEQQLKNRIKIFKGCHASKTNICTPLATKERRKPSFLHYVWYFQDVDAMREIPFRRDVDHRTLWSASVRALRWTQTHGTNSPWLCAGFSSAL